MNNLWYYMQQNIPFNILFQYVHITHVGPDEAF